MSVFGGPKLEKVVKHPLYELGGFYNIERNKAEYIEIYVFCALAEIAPIADITTDEQKEAIAIIGVEGAKEFETIWERQKVKEYRVIERRRRRNDIFN